MQWSAEHQKVNMRTPLGTKEAENNDDNENLKTVSDGGVYDELMSACYKSRNPTEVKSRDEFESFLFSQEQ